MSIKLLLRDHPHRAIALVTGSHILLLRHSPSTIQSAANGALNTVQPVQPQIQGGASTAPRCIAEFSNADSVDLSDFRPSYSLPVQGTLGLITINNDVFLCVVSGASRVATLRPGETVQRIHAVDFYCLNNSDLDLVLTDEVEDPSRDGYEHPCHALKKLLGGGTFYYSTDFDLTSRMQDRVTEKAVFDIDNHDEAFLWNSYMIAPLVKFRSHLSPHEREALDQSRILTSAIRGFALTVTIPASTSPARTARSGLPSALTVISRLSCRRAGTRFNARGIDDDGNVANFVETETVYWIPPGLSFSYAQIRGSVPVFWEQATGLLPGQQKIQITRSPEATQPAFDKHFEGLEVDYGSVHVLNLLSETKPGEADLTSRYRYHVRHSPSNQALEKGDQFLLKETEFDFHAETKGPGGYEAASMIRHLIEGAASGFAYYLCEEDDDAGQDPKAISNAPRPRSTVVLQQEGVFRTNCLDCLDRTNLIQTIISQMALESFLNHRGERALPDFWMRHSSVWADNGDSLSKIYAGTGALKSSFTRHGKMSLAGAIADARKSATRVYMNNFADKGRQSTMDMMLGRLMGQAPVYLYDPINDYVTTELGRRLAEYSSSKTIRIWAGTFNLNGRTTGINEDLSSWLCSDVDVSQQDPEIVAVGFQEIVELSPQQIMSTDPAIRQAWEKAVRRTLNEHARKRGAEEYIILRSGQLVGAALSIFVKANVLSDIKNVEGSVKKTGLSGVAGNKGAVAIRMDYANTQICFVTAHLAAGFANYEERNRDYNTISHGLRFQRNRSIDDHDTVIWLGDFNYRIGLSDERVKKGIQMGDLDALYENDQLNLQMVAGLTFPYYSEARITFLPTYKYDVGTDTYDTSEKVRIPAWCDRILRKGSNLRQIAYNTAPLRFSDHRPVYATFQCIVSVVNEALKNQMSQDIYERRRNEVGNTMANAGDDDTDDEDLIGYDAISPGLPPASSDRRKWWLDNGLPVRATVQPPSQYSIPNPQRPSNPFVPTDQPDWVQPPRAPISRGNSQQSRPPISSNPSSAMTGHPRKVPPRFEPTNSASKSSKAEVTQRVPKPSPDSDPSSQTSSRTSSPQATTKKKKPPVPKKPVRLLSSDDTRRASVDSNAKLPLDAHAPRQVPSLPPSMDSVANVNPINTAFPPPPHRVVNSSNQKGPQDVPASNPGQQSLRNTRPQAEEKGPSLPPQPTVGDSKQRHELMDDTDPESSNLSSWKPLRPG